VDDPDILPVIPPELRPMIQLMAGGLPHHLNDLYRRVVTATTGFKRLLDLGAPDVISAMKSACCRKRSIRFIDTPARQNGLSPEAAPTEVVVRHAQRQASRFRRNLLASVSTIPDGQ